MRNTRDNGGPGEEAKRRTKQQAVEEDAGADEDQADHKEVREVRDTHRNHHCDCCLIV